jgi:multicomponent Na+:H+ antiporter subunit D
VFHHAGIKIPYFAFFSHDSGIRCAEAPRNMLIAMGIAAALCIGIGVFPDALYALLPYSVSYEPYTSSHVVAQLQLLFFSALAFAVLMRTGIYPPELRSINLDSDWFYRSLAPAAIRMCRNIIRRIQRARTAALNSLADRIMEISHRETLPQGLLVRTWPTRSMALWVMAMLLAYMLFYYLG